MQRQPGESDNDYFGRVYQARRARRLSDLERARAEALLKGKEPFEYQRFREAYLHVKPYAPEPLERPPATTKMAEAAASSPL